MISKMNEMSQDQVQKNYYEQLMVGHYIDVKYSESEWKIAKIIERDKRYAVVQYEGIHYKDQQIYLGGHKTAPLRFHTEGYTGSVYRVYRPNPTPLSQYKNHLEVMQQMYLRDSIPNAFTSTQYIRGELFVLVHSLLTREQLKEQEANDAMTFLLSFVEFVAKFGRKVLKMGPESFEAIANNNKLIYLSHDKVAFTNCLNQLLVLLNLLIRAETSKHITIFRSKQVSQQTIVNIYSELRCEGTYADLFKLNDSNGKWLSFNIHKHLYFLLKKYQPKFVLPTYSIRDYMQVFTIYPFVIREQEKSNKVEDIYTNFVINCLKEVTSFQAKLKALQELKKIVQGEVKLFRIEQKQVISMIGSQGVIEHMLSQYHFNPQIFKRFIPVLQKYCKVKSINLKSISSLFKLATNRHQSEVSVIFQIVCLLAQFVQLDALDMMYSEILKYNINSQQTLSLVKNFTVNAILNYSRQKSFLASIFRKNKNSSKFGYYGLDLIFREIQDEGGLNKSSIGFAVDHVREIFGFQIFQAERVNYLNTCIDWLQKIRNYGQGIKLIDAILSTFPSTSFFGQNRKDLLQKLIQKNNLLTMSLFGLKVKTKINQNKMSMPDIIKAFYDLVQNNYDIIIPFIKIEHIEFMWTLGQSKQLSSFVRRSKNPEAKKKQFKQKYIKKLEENVQEDILNKLTKTQHFYDRTLTIEEFDALDEIFMSYNLIKKKIDISQMGMLRYYTPEMEGEGFYFEFMQRLVDSPHFDKVIKKTINLFLRPKDQKDIDLKALTWKNCLLRMVQKLKTNPQACLKAINLFFQMIEGKLIKTNVSFPGTVDVNVIVDTQQKAIILPRNNTIFKLRKQIMLDFCIGGDFTLFSPAMKRDISFFEEEEFSLNALTNSHNDRGPVIHINNKKREKHPQMQAVDRFKELIEKQEMFYSMLFQLNSPEIHQIFWRTVDLLPVNRQLIRKIQNCANFQKKEWSKLLKSQADESLQYHLNIVYELMENNPKWVSLFFGSGGMDIMVELLGDRLKDEQVVVERIVNRCILILVSVLSTVAKIEESVLEELKLVLIAKLINLFKGDLSAVSISIDSLSNIFHLLQQINKILKKKTIEIQIDIILKILQYGIFKPKNKVNLQFIEEDFQHYLINNYSSQDEKIIIYVHLLNFLSLKFLNNKQNSELFYVFLIDYMNTFIETERELIQKQKYLQIIKGFVIEILTGQHEDPSTHSYNHLIYGCLKLLLYTLNHPSHLYNLTDIFQLLLKEFLFNNKGKRIKHQITTKLLYECVKKILFSQQNLIQMLVAEVAPQLRVCGWRKNTFNSFLLESKRQERNKFVGLENLGATCYLNCLTQQLFMIPHFRQHFLSIDSTGYRESPAQNEILQYQKIFAGLKHSTHRSINTRKLCQSFITYEGAPINPAVQSDADQFFNQLMQKIQTFLKQNKRHDIIENTFEGKLSNQLNCEGCPHKSEKEDHFMSIGVNIRGKKTLEEALEGFVEGEILDGDNAYFCEICQKKVRTQKRLCIKHLPNILPITIKRFQFNYDQMRKIKINTYLKFPVELNMKPYTAQHLGGASDLSDDAYKYNLRGVVIHSGTSEGGHYYSFIYQEGKWHCFNDEFIEEAKYSRIEEDSYGGEDKSLEGEFKFQKHKNAYILFYQKQHPSESYHPNETITSPFGQKLERIVKKDNHNAEFLSVMLDSHFIRLTQNFSVLENQEAYRFSFLYFHTVVLRDRNKEEHIPNYFRILDGLLERKQVSQWYLDQVNNKFIKEFMVEAPRTVRFISTSLVLKALSCVNKISENFIGHALSSLRKNGMTPFGHIFTYLSKNPETRAKLVDWQYPQRVVALLLDKTNQNFNMLEMKSFESYFGAEISQKEKQVQPCHSNICESLGQFDIAVGDAVQILEKYASRAGSKALGRLLASRVTEDQLSTLLISLESTVIKQGELKRDELQKYLFLVRSACLITEQHGEWRIEKCIYSLKKMLYECRTTYQPMQTLLRQLNYIAARSTQFMEKWTESLVQKEQLYDYVKILKFWLKEAEHPHYLHKSDEFKRKISALSYEEKYQVEAANRVVLEKRVTWMIQVGTHSPQLYDSDLQDSKPNREVLIRNKRVKIKQHLGLIKKVQHQGHQRWAILEKNELDLYHSL